MLSWKGTESNLDKKKVTKGNHASDTHNQLSEALELQINMAAKAEKKVIDYVLLMIETRWLPAEFDYINKGEWNFELLYDWDEFQAKISYFKWKTTFYTMNSDSWDDTYYFDKWNVLIHTYKNNEEVNSEEIMETVLDNQDILESFTELLDYPWATYLELDLELS